MPRQRPPYLQRLKNRHGNFVWYVHRRPAKRVLIRAEYGTPEFEAAYSAALSVVSTTPTRGPSTAPGTRAWLWARYRETGLWAALSPATKRQRENIMIRVLKVSGSAPCDGIDAEDITAAMDKMAATPFQAQHFLKVMRGIFKWAAKAGHVKADPTLGVSGSVNRKSGGHQTWTEGDIDAYQARWPLGTKERVWLDVLLYTGLRRGDAVRLGRQHVKDGVATLQTEKSQGAVTVTLPILPVLAQTLEAGPTSASAFICGGNGKPLTKGSFGNMFRRACNAAGIVGKAAHGVRKAGATRAADNGATVHELEAIFGWSGGGMAALYTRTADRKRASARAMSLMEKR
jgi:integrase